MRCRTKDEVQLTVDDTDPVIANWNQTTSDENLRNTDRLLWIGTCDQTSSFHTGLGL